MQEHDVGELWKMAEGWGKAPVAVAKNMQGEEGKKKEPEGLGEGRAKLAKGEDAVQRDGRILPQ